MDKNSGVQVQVMKTFNKMNDKPFKLISELQHFNREDKLTDDHGQVGFSGPWATNL